MNWRYFRKPVVESTVEGEMSYSLDDESRLNMIDRIVHTRLIPVLQSADSSNFPKYKKLR